MPPKAKLPAPIDRPISRAYLREFTGWSTAYPPGVSDSTSLRVMDNMMIQRDGSIRIRPGLRYLSYAQVPTEVDPGTAFTLPVVGTHEPFYLNDNTKAYLMACREPSGRVGFRVLANRPEGQVVITLLEAGFVIPQGEEIVVVNEESYKGINFSERTTYVKYLQIDNKIFALSDAGETMRLFYVGEEKRAKRLTSIERPTWNVGDKLKVVHPDAAWINSGAPLGTRTNYVTNPGMRVNTDKWIAYAGTTVKYDTDQQLVGAASLQVSSAATRTNLMPYPLQDVVATGVAGWGKASDVAAPTVDATTNALKFTLGTGAIGEPDYIYSPMAAVKAGTDYSFAYDVAAITNIRRLHVMGRFYNSADVKVGSDVTYANATLTVGRKALINVKPPTGATKARFFIYAERKTSSGVNSVSIKNAMLCLETESSAMFHGGSGTDYFWVGAANSTASVYHPPKDVGVRTVCTVGPGTYTGSASVRGSTSRSAHLDLIANSATALLLTDVGADTADATGSWTRLVNSGAMPTGTTTVTLAVWFKAVPRGETHNVDAAMLEKAAAVDSYFDGGTGDVPALVHAWTGTANASTSTEKAYDVGSTIPAAETKTTKTLISSTAASNTFNFGFFYTFSNEVGESAVSAVTVVRTQRAWSAWQWETPNATGEPSGTDTQDPILAADQLVAYMPASVFEDGLASGAISWNLYMYTWSDQDPMPVQAVRVATTELDTTAVYGSDGWLRATPSSAEAGSENMMVPTKGTRYNYSNPSRGGQGIVAADRMVVVKDPTAAAVIRWTSNQQGSYTDFSASRGGGYKTLTSGNLFIPACVKLWQNPQSADTLTVLCRGVDGYNTGYYMAPAQIASQSEAVNVMGFEETTATPGTTSPYGCEVFNNALYHPLDDQLMKSSATNYNINHKSQTDMIENVWKSLTRKDWIISSVHDNRIYYIVNNPAGAPLELGCNGNEIWVFDGGASSDKGGGSWSRWTVQAHSLRKIEQGGMIRMSVVKPDGLYYFDELYGMDDYVGVGDKIANRGIPWRIETNTQGANRAHDAFAHLQQANITVGNFTGNMCYGIKGWNVHGQPVDAYKHLSDLEPPGDGMFDFEDFLLIRQDMKEWFFYAFSETDENGFTLPSFGEINLVQYRYSPVSVNVGYEYGSIETFEYGRAEYLGARGLPDELTTNGVPRPYVDTRRP